MNKTRLTLRQWLSFIVAGLVGQLAWAIENNYLGRYIYYATTNATNPDLGMNFIPVMTAASAAAATITTLIIGALSDKIGKRRMFVYLGYIIWGVSIIAFSFIDQYTLTSWFGNLTNIAFISGTLIVIMDCVMTVFGSTANDACFNAMVNDQTDSSNRSKVEGVLAILPLIAMIIIVLAGGPLVDTKDPADANWRMFFIIFGAITTVAGIICIFLLPKDVKKPAKDTHFWKEFIYGFRPKNIKNHKILYFAYITTALFSIGVQIFMPYLMVYVERYAGISGGNFTITLGFVLVISSIITILLGLFMDKLGKFRVIIPALCTSITGAVLIGALGKNIGVVGAIICTTLLMSGYLTSTSILTTIIRDCVPGNKTGHFQGIRMVFIVLLPMVTGPYIGQGLSYINAQYYNDVNLGGAKTLIPNNYIFFAAAAVFALTIIPIIFLMRADKKGLIPKKVGIQPAEEEPNDANA